MRAKRDENHTLLFCHWQKSETYHADDAFHFQKQLEFYQIKSSYFILHNGITDPVRIDWQQISRIINYLYILVWHDYVICYNKIINNLYYFHKIIVLHIRIHIYYIRVYNQ